MRRRGEAPVIHRPIAEDSGPTMLRYLLVASLWSGTDRLLCQRPLGIDGLAPLLKRENLQQVEVVLATLYISTYLQNSVMPMKFGPSLADPRIVYFYCNLLCTGIKPDRSASGSQLVEDDLWDFSLWLSIPTEPLG